MADNKQATAMMAPIAVSMAEAARLLGVSRPKLYEMARQPGFPCFRAGGRVLVSRAGLEAWVRRQALGGGEDCA